MSEGYMSEAGVSTLSALRQTNHASNTMADTTTIAIATVKRSMPASVGKGNGKATAMLLGAAGKTSSGISAAASSGAVHRRRSRCVAVPEV